MEPQLCSVCLDGALRWETLKSTPSFLKTSELVRRHEGEGFLWSTVIRVGGVPPLHSPAPGSALRCALIKFKQYTDRGETWVNAIMSCKQLPIHTRAVARFSLCAEIDILVSVEKGWGCRNEMLTLFEFRKMRRSEDSEISLNPVAPSRRHEVKVHQWTFARIWGGWPTYISWASQHQRCWRRLATVHVRVGGTIDALQRALGWGWRGVGLFDKISQPGSSNRRVANVGWTTRRADVGKFWGLST